jgi:hypothetical protein
VALKAGTVGVIFLAFLTPAFGQYTTVRYLSREEAAPVFAALQEPLPAAGEWTARIAERDRATRARVSDGDEASIVNWLLFGTSFTRQPRITGELSSSPELTDLVSRRIDDLVRVLGGKAADERLEFARTVVGTGDGARRRLVSALERAILEREMLARRDRDARQLGDSSLEFAERSRIYRDRGLSTDTSIRSSFAVDQALEEMKRRGSLVGPVRRVAIIGPGLDFVDKQAGHDRFPPQTVQPFAIQDSLFRLGLAAPGEIQVVALDLNPRVNAHVTRASRLLHAGRPYTIRLQLDESTPWTPAFIAFWKRLGEHIGTRDLESIHVRPGADLDVSASDVNVASQYLVLDSAARFDLVVATNVFVYYDRLEQGLAAASISRMMRPDGILLSNNAIVEIPDVPLRSAGYSRTLHSDISEDGDLVIWYRRVR